MADQQDMLKEADEVEAIGRDLVKQACVYFEPQSTNDRKLQLIRDAAACFAVAAALRGN